jgi:hypothetical protein
MPSAHGRETTVDGATDDSCGRVGLTFPKAFQGKNSPQNAVLFVMGQCTRDGARRSNGASYATTGECLRHCPSSTRPVEGADCQ